jgi:hypothetical protein
MAPPQQQPPLMTQMHPMHHHHMHQHPQHNNGHHHNGLYLPAYGNEYYPGATDQHGHTAYLIPPEYCPTHAPMCTMHSDYGKRFLLFCFVPFCINLLSRFRFGFGTWIWVLKMVVFNGFFVFWIFLNSLFFSITSVSSMRHVTCGTSIKPSNFSYL